jgi:hypothetical protein
MFLAVIGQVAMHATVGVCRLYQNLQSPTQLAGCYGSSAPHMAPATLHNPMPMQRLLLQWHNADNASCCPHAAILQTYPLLLHLSMFFHITVL